MCVLRKKGKKKFFDIQFYRNKALRVPSTDVIRIVNAGITLSVVVVVVLLVQIFFRL